MTTKEKIAVMQSYEDGKQIQRKYGWLNLQDEVDTDWEDDIKPLWDWNHCDYRVKPEEKKPEYRPYKDTEEMIADFKERFNVNCPDHAMPLIWVRLSNTEDVRTWLITTYGDNFVVMAKQSYAMHRLFQEFTYLDGSPCGKLEDKK